MRAVAALVIPAFFVLAGCHSDVAVAPASQPVVSHEALLASQHFAPQYLDSVEARCTPPIGWRAEPLKQDNRRSHQIWVSPTGQTAYGVIRFSVPLPVGAELVLIGFLSELKRTEGNAVLIEKQWDSNHNVLRFVADSEQHRIRTNLVVRGFDAWAIYAATIRDESIDPDELSLAEKARDNTEVGPTQPPEVK